MKACLISLPTSVRMGMFWRFGSLLDSLPVAVTVWLSEVWSLPGLRVDHGRKRVDIGRFELGERAVFQDLGGQGMDVRQFLEHIHVRGKAGLGPFDRRELRASRTGSRQAASCELMLNSVPASSYMVFSICRHLLFRASPTCFSEIRRRSLRRSAPCPPGLP